MKQALITGALGQDGTYLSEYLLSLGYRVFGLVRRNPQTSEWGMPLLGKVEYIYGDLRDEESLVVAIRKSWPDEIYNLGGQVSVPVSWDVPAETFDVNLGGLARILKNVSRIKVDARIYQANSATMFGNHDGACSEETPFNPRSPYCVSKVAAHNLVGLYRQKGLFVVSGILFNHESPRRGHEMVTRKIARHVAYWRSGNRTNLSLGLLDSRRDWGFAGDYVEMMHAMLQEPVCRDYVLGTGVSHSVRELIETACAYAGVSHEFIEQYVIEDDRMVRANEIYDARADCSMAESVLGWKPKVDFETLVAMMVKAEMDRFGVPIETPVESR